MILIDGKPLHIHPCSKTNLWLHELKHAIAAGKTVTLLSLELSKDQCDEHLKRILSLASVKSSNSR
jgi:hypothetical protein